MNVISSDFKWFEGFQVNVISSECDFKWIRILVNVNVNSSECDFKWIQVIWRISSECEYECDFKWMWFQVNSSECDFKWMWFQVNSSECECDF